MSKPRHPEEFKIEDITYIRAYESWLFLEVVLDLTTSKSAEIQKAVR